MTLTEVNLTKDELSLIVDALENYRVAPFTNVGLKKKIALQEYFRGLWYVAVAEEKAQ